METFEFNYKSYKREELSKELLSLVEASAVAAKMAYAPFSSFSVGAIARLADGLTIAASNQESVSFPTGICAERALLFSYFNSNNFPTNKIELVIISAFKHGNMQSVSPCGICRQSLIEAEARQEQDISILFLSQERYILVESAKMLLPFSFLSI